MKNKKILARRVLVSILYSIILILQNEKLKYPFILKLKHIIIKES